MSRLRCQAEDLTAINATIYGLARTLEDDLAIRECEGGQSFFTPFHQGTILTAIAQLTHRAIGLAEEIEQDENERLDKLAGQKRWGVTS